MRRISHRNFVMAMLIVLVWLGFVISGSHALLSQSASLTENSLTIGSAGLLISNSQDANPISFDASASGFGLPVNPGSSIDRYFTLKNTSSAGIPLDIDMTTVIPGQATPLLASYVTVSVVPVDATGNQIPDTIAAEGSLKTLTNSHVKLGGFIPENGMQRYRLRITIDSEDYTPNETLLYNLIFTGTQRLI